MGTQNLEQNENADATDTQIMTFSLDGTAQLDDNHASGFNEQDFLRNLSKQHGVRLQLNLSKLQASASFVELMPIHFSRSQGFMGFASGDGLDGSNSNAGADGPIILAVSDLNNLNGVDVCSRFFGAGD